MIKLLIIDDDQGIAEGLTRMAHNLGQYNVKTAFDGHEAIQLIREFEPDIVISDVVLPGVNGLELLDLCKEEHPYAQVILATGFPTPELLQTAVLKGAVEVLRKPFRREDLFRTLTIAERFLNLYNRNVLLEKQLKEQVNLTKLSQIGSI